MRERERERERDFVWISQKFGVKKIWWWCSQLLSTDTAPRKTSLMPGDFRSIFNKNELFKNNNKRIFFFFFFWEKETLMLKPFLENGNAQN
jgi:hypothetical protein